MLNSLLYMERLKSIWNKTSAHDEAAHLLQQVCCCEQVTLCPVVYCVKTAESEVSVHGTVPSKSFLPALHTPSCANWIWIMEEQVIWCLWCLQKDRWYVVSSLRWQTQSYRNVFKSLLAKLGAAAGRASLWTVLKFSWGVPDGLKGSPSTHLQVLWEQAVLPHRVQFSAQAMFLFYLLLCVIFSCWM